MRRILPFTSACFKYKCYLFVAENANTTQKQQRSYALHLYRRRRTVCGALRDSRTQYKSE